MFPRLILASSSPYRRTLLERLQLDFETIAPQVDETAQPGESPAELATRLAHRKAQAIAERHPDAVVIGSDQVAELDGRALGKPGTVERAQAQLNACSGKSVIFHTSLCVLAPESPAQTHLDWTEVRFRVLSAARIDHYIAREQPLDCAGAFRCEGLGIALFATIDSRDPTALIGLPMIEVAAALSRVGLDPLAAAAAAPGAR